MILVQLLANNIIQKKKRTSQLVFYFGRYTLKNQHDHLDALDVDG